MHIRPTAARDRQALLDVWLRSVRATHAFVSEADIVELLPQVRDYLAAPDAGLWTLCNDDDMPIGFMGLVGATVESLFIAPDQLRRGGGRLLLAHARTLAGDELLSVDVNEENADALSFYRASGFEVVGRSPTDDAGRPFPLLHLRETARPPRPKPHTA